MLGFVLFIRFGPLGGSNLAEAVETKVINFHNSFEIYGDVGQVLRPSDLSVCFIWIGTI